MLPTITRLKTPIKNGGEITRWVVEGENYGWDVYDALLDAVKRWLQIAFSNKSTSKSRHAPPQSNIGKNKALAKRRKKNKNKKTHR